MPKVPGYLPPNKRVLARQRAEFMFTKADNVLHKRLHELDEHIKILKIEQKAIVRALKNKNLLTRKGVLLPVKLYALQLEDQCWYVGMSFNPDKRFRKHLNGKGASWTKLHKPIKIVEIRITELFDQDDVVELENDMTLEYALKYGSEYVRGGGYCQAKPYWPDVVLQHN